MDVMVKIFENMFVVLFEKQLFTVLNVFNFIAAIIRR